MATGVGDKKVYEKDIEQISNPSTESNAAQFIKALILIITSLALGSILMRLCQTTPSTDKKDLKKVPITPMGNNSSETDLSSAGAIGKAGKIYQTLYATAEKRSQQATVPPKQYIFPDQIGIPSGEVALCCSYDECMALSTFSLSQNDYPRVQLFGLSQGAQPLFSNSSSNITSQITSLQFPTWPVPLLSYHLSCHRGNYQSLYFRYDPSFKYLTCTHFAIQNHTLTIPPFDYMSGFWNWYTIGTTYLVPKYPYDVWKPASLTQNQAVWAVYNASGTFMFATNTSGSIPTDSRGFGIATNLSSPPTYQDILSFEDGSFHLFTNLSDANHTVKVYDASRNVTAMYPLYNKTIAGLTTYNTPLPVGTRYVGLASPEGIYTYDSVDHTILSYQPLNETEGNITIAHCGPQNPEIFFWGRETENGTLQYDFGDARTGQSLLGGEQKYNNYTRGNSSARPEVGCMNGKGIFGFVDEFQDAVFFTVTLPSVASSTPTSTPGALPGPSVITVAVTSDPNNPLEITVSNTTIKMEIVDPNGFSFKFADGTTAPEGFFPADIFKNIIVTRVNATGDAIPTLRGCNILDECDFSVRAKTPLTHTFGSERLKLEIILPATLVPVTIAAVAALLITRLCQKQVFPFRNREHAINDFAVRSTAEETQKKTKNSNNKVDNQKDEQYEAWDG